MELASWWPGAMIDHVRGRGAGGTCCVRLAIIMMVISNENTTPKRKEFRLNPEPAGSRRDAGSGAARTPELPVLRRRGGSRASAVVAVTGGGPAMSARIDVPARGSARCPGSAMREPATSASVVDSAIGEGAAALNLYDESGVADSADAQEAERGAVA